MREHLLQPYGDSATREAPEQWDIASSRDLLGIAPQLDAAPGHHPLHTCRAILRVGPQSGDGPLPMLQLLQSGPPTAPRRLCA